MLIFYFSENENENENEHENENKRHMWKLPISLIFSSNFLLGRGNASGTFYIVKFDAEQNTGYKLNKICNIRATTKIQVDGFEIKFS